MAKSPAWQRAEGKDPKGGLNAKGRASAQVADSPVDKTAWATYRQALRDITKQADPFKIEWPKQNAI